MYVLGLHNVQRLAGTVSVACILILKGPGLSMAQQHYHGMGSVMDEHAMFMMLSSKTLASVLHGTEAGVDYVSSC